MALEKGYLGYKRSYSTGLGLSVLIRLRLFDYSSHGHTSTSAPRGSPCESYISRPRCRTCKDTRLLETAAHSLTNREGRPRPVYWLTGMKLVELQIMQDSRQETAFSRPVQVRCNVWYASWIRKVGYPSGLRAQTSQHRLDGARWRHKLLLCCS